MLLDRHDGPNLGDQRHNKADEAQSLGECGRQNEDGEGASLDLRLTGHSARGAESSKTDGECCADDTKTVTDYKTGTVWKVMFDEWDDYHKQLLMYAYMLRKIGFDCKNGQIVMILKDHSKTKAKLDPTYPKYPVYVKKFNFTDEDFANIENFINERFKAYKQYENVPDALLPSCTKEERWHKDDKYAVMKKGRKTAIKLCDSEEEANSKVAELGTGHYVEFREGKDGRCDDYCQVKDFCPFYRKKQSV